MSNNKWDCGKTVISNGKLKGTILSNVKSNQPGREITIRWNRHPKLYRYAIDTSKSIHSSENGTIEAVQ